MFHEQTAFIRKTVNFTTDHKTVSKVVYQNNLLNAITTYKEGEMRKMYLKNFYEINYQQPTMTRL